MRLRVRQACPAPSVSCASTSCAIDQGPQKCYKTLFQYEGEESVEMPVVERFTGFLAAERNASEETIRAYRREVERLQRFLREERDAGDVAPVDWSKVTAADLRRFFCR